MTLEQDSGKVMSLQDSDHGDFDEEVEVDGYTEELVQYRVGLCYPIRIGDMLEGTYRIEHKLNHGESSTVWLAHDTEKQKDVALKIIFPGDRGEYEYSMQKEIKRTVEDTSNLVIYLTSFSLPGCSGKGNHRVLVFDVRGPSLSYHLLKQTSMATRMSAARQLLKALECLHNAGIVHHGELAPASCSLDSVHANYSTDLNESNVMFGVAPLDNLSTKAKYELLGRPKKLALPSNLWRQGELVRPLKVPKSLLTDTVYLGDFGLATKAGTEVRHKMLSPRNIVYYAPERFHNVNPSFASDMWSYMCLFTRLYIGYTPWYSYSYCSVITEMVRTLGPLPMHWKGYYNAYGTWDNSWYDQHKMCDPKVALESFIKEQRPEVSSVERNHVLKIMCQVFRYSPDGRPTATQLLQDPSFKAIMEIYCN